MNKKAFTLSLVLMAIALPAMAQSVIPTRIATANTTIAEHTNHDLAFNDKAGVYLRVWGHPAVWGAFVSADGAMIGAPFLISAMSGSDALPRVAYSKGSAADDVFWVTFTSEQAGRYVYSRLVRYAPGAANNVWMGPVQPVSTGGYGPLQKTGGITFDPFRRQFFGTWHGIVNGDWEALGQVWQLSGSASTPSLSPASAVLAISGMPNAQGEPNIAFDWQHNKYLVIFMGEHPQSELIKGTWARIVTFDAALNPSYSPAIEISSGGGPIEQNVVYLPESDNFLTFWTSLYGGARDLVGSLLNHNGAVPGVFTIMGTPSGEGAADADYNPSTRTILVAAQRDQTKYAQGAILTGTGSIIEYFPATTVLPTGSLESVAPQVAAASAGRFGVSYLNTYTFGFVDLFQAALAATPGPAPGGGGPPPPPPCAVEPLPGATTVNVSGASQTRTISVTASTADCAWSATSSASWLTVTGGASGAGPGTTTYAVTRNTSGATRSATVTIGGGRVAVVQAASFTNAALHNISGARASDIMWHNVNTGHVAVWDVEGWTVARAYYLTSTPVPTSWKVVGTGDLNGDGFADIVWHHSSGVVAVWFVQNGTSIGAQYLSLDGATASETAPWEIRAVGDLDGDGKCDIIWQNSDGTLGVWYMDGGTVRSRASFNLGMTDSNWKIAGAGDLNQDGKADIVWQNHVTGSIAAWAMDGHTVIWTGPLSPSTATRVPDTTWKIRGVGDTNGDGFADIVWQNMSTGDLGVWFLRYATVLEQRALTIPKVPDTSWHVVGPG
jgi:VCBS repeat protein/all-beta uncharacterized protein/FG-GAP repeat protein